MYRVLYTLLAKPYGQWILLIAADHENERSRSVTIMNSAHAGPQLVAVEPDPDRGQV